MSKDARGKRLARRLARERVAHALEHPDVFAVLLAHEFALGEYKRSRPRRLPKFRNLDDPVETWMGRGKRPNWLKAQLAAGRSLEDFRVRD
jgi:DNA-binding protein H-NS